MRVPLPGGATTSAEFATPEADIRDRGELVTGNGMPEQLVGSFRLTPLSPWIRWTASTTQAFPSLCAAFDRLTGKDANS